VFASRSRRVGQLMPRLRLTSIAMLVGVPPLLTADSAAAAAAEQSAASMLPQEMSGLSLGLGGIEPELGLGIGIGLAHATSRTMIPSAPRTRFKCRDARAFVSLINAQRARAC